MLNPISTTLSTATYLGDGASNEFNFAIERIRNTDVLCKVNDIVVPLTHVVADTYTVAIVPESGADIVILRSTNIDTAEKTFPNRSYIRSENLDKNMQQSMFLDQELTDAINRGEVGSVAYIDYQIAIVNERIDELEKRQLVKNLDSLSSAVNNVSLEDGDALNLQEREVGSGGGAMWDVVLASSVTPNTFDIVQCVGVPTLAIKRREESFLVSQTINVPSDYATLQEAFDAAKYLKVTSGQHIDIVIETGHSPASGILAIDGDYSHIRISSVDAVVTVAAGFGQNAAFINGDNARMPVLNCLVSGNAGAMGFGYRCEKNSNGYVTAGNGVTDCWQDGITCKYGSTCYAEDTVWTGNAMNGTTSAGAICWGGLLYLKGGDVSNSGYYGAQAAHGGVLNFQYGFANNTGRYGVRGSDGAYIDADGTTANDNTLYGIYSFNRCSINFRSGTATGNGSANVVSVNSSSVNATEAILTGSLDVGILCSGGSSVDAFDVDCSGAAGFGISVNSASIVSAKGANCNNCATGIIVSNASSASFENATANNCSADGIVARSGSSIDAQGTTANDCMGYGIRAWYGATINFLNGQAKRATSRGVYAYSGSKIMASGVDARKVDGVDTGGSNGDIVCLRGSNIIAHTAAGGKNKTTNVLDSDGVIYQ